MQIKTNLEIYAISPTLLSLFVALEMKNSKFYMEVGSVSGEISLKGVLGGRLTWITPIF